MKTKAKIYNDGYLDIYRQPTTTNAFKAAENVTGITANLHVVKLAYKTKTLRASDIEWAEHKDKNLSAKVVTRLYPGVNTSHQALIGNTIYSIINVDYDKDNQEMYLYLEEARKIVNGN